MPVPPPALDDATLWRICEILAATDDGLTNSELDRLLRDARIADPTPRDAGPGTYLMVSKRERLHTALSARQRADGHAAGVLRFVKTAMQPARYTATPELFEERRHELNVTLSFAALRLEEDGKLVRVRAASTLTDARRRAQRLRQSWLTATRTRGCSPPASTRSATRTTSMRSWRPPRAWPQRSSARPA